jgi:hypothetical protein
LGSLAVSRPTVVDARNANDRSTIHSGRKQRCAVISGSGTSHHDPGCRDAQLPGRFELARCEQDRSSKTVLTHRQPRHGIDRCLNPFAIISILRCYGHSDRDVGNPAIAARVSAVGEVGDAIATFITLVNELSAGIDLHRQRFGAGRRQVDQQTCGEPNDSRYDMTHGWQSRPTDDQTPNTSVGRPCKPWEQNPSL